MLVRVEGTQSGGAVYRRVVLRNIFCTIAVVTSYTIMAVVVVHALLRETAESNKVRMRSKHGTLRTKVIHLLTTHGLTTCKSLSHARRLYALTRAA